MSGMDDQTKKNIKKVVQEAETGVAKSILRWKYKKEGRPVPVDHQLENDSRQVADRVHKVIARRSKNVWKELKKVYNKGIGEKER